MSTIAKVLTGWELEQLLIEFSNMLIEQAFSSWDGGSKAKVQGMIIETSRYFLAGFPVEKIIEEACGSKTNEFGEQLYGMVSTVLPEIGLTDGKSGDTVSPKVWDVIAKFEASHDYSIDQARMFAVLKPTMLFAEGDYRGCAEFGTIGAAGYGRPMFYQLAIIANARLGNEDAVESMGVAARNALQVVSPWHQKLVELTLGVVTADELYPKARDNDDRFQVRFFEGIRALTNGNKAEARRLLTAASGMPRDLAIEALMLDAELKRC